MSEVQQILTDGEEMKKRVAMLCEQERAMREVLPQRYAANMGL